MKGKKRRFPINRRIFLEKYGNVPDDTEINIFVLSSAIVIRSAYSLLQETVS